MEIITIEIDNSYNRHNRDHCRIEVLRQLIIHSAYLVLTLIQYLTLINHVDWEKIGVNHTTYMIILYTFPNYVSMLHL